jgi:hypothetical protein
MEIGLGVRVERDKAGRAQGDGQDRYPLLASNRPPWKGKYGLLVVQDVSD